MAFKSRSKHLPLKAQLAANRINAKNAHTSLSPEQEAATHNTFENLSTADLAAIISSSNPIPNTTKVLSFYSATNITFIRDNGQVKLVVGDRSTKPPTIPEKGRLAMPGGANGYSPEEVDPRIMLKDLANRHMEEQLGIALSDDQYSEFLQCEYPPTAPLKTDLGANKVKRIAHNRIVEITPKQFQEAKPSGRLKSLRMITLEEFEKALEKGEVSFGYQADHVRQAFALMEQGFEPKNIKAGWYNNSPQL